MSRLGDREAEQNPYCSPACVDETPSGGWGRQQARDLSQAGLLLGLTHGAAAGAAATVCLSSVESLVELAGGHGPQATLDSWGRELVTSLVAVAMLGALIGAASGANLGFLQGVWAARAPAGRVVQRLRRAAFCWALVAVVWCVLIALQTMGARSPRWLIYLALLAAPAAAGFAGARVAVRLARLRPAQEPPAESTGRGDAGQS